VRKLGKMRRDDVGGRFEIETSGIYPSLIIKRKLWVMLRKGE
jgi:hypothetical protein